VQWLPGLIVNGIGFVVMVAFLTVRGSRILRLSQRSQGKTLN
jgi:hypothetical protein